MRRFLLVSLEVSSSDLPPASDPPPPPLGSVHDENVPESELDLNVAWNCSDGEQSVSSPPPNKAELNQNPHAPVPQPTPNQEFAYLYESDYSALFDDLELDLPLCGDRRSGGGCVLPSSTTTNGSNTVAPIQVEVARHKRFPRDQHHSTTRIVYYAPGDPLYQSDDDLGPPDDFINILHPQNAHLGRPFLQQFHSINAPSSSPIKSKQSTQHNHPATTKRNYKKYTNKRRRA